MMEQQILEMMGQLLNEGHVVKAYEMAIKHGINLDIDELVVTPYLLKQQ